MKSKVEKVVQKHASKHILNSNHNIRFFIVTESNTKDINGSEGWIYASFKTWSDEGISVDRMWHDHRILMCLDAFLPLYAACTGSIFRFQMQHKNNIFR